MSDRYSAFASSALGRRVIGPLGLPDPTPLRRYHPGAPALEGPALFGGPADGDTRVLEAAQAAALASGVDARTTDGAAQLTANERPAALVFDAAGITDPAELVALHTFFSPTIRSLTRCGRVVVLGRPPDRCDGGARVAQRAIEGFTRSLGKEVGRGSTVNLVHVESGAEDALGSTLQFLLSARSAYVSGQVLRVGLPVDAASPESVQTTTADGAQLAGKVAIVTGASRGIGAAIVDVLVRDGATVVGVDVPAAASDLARQARSTGGSYLPLDVTAVDAAPRLVRHATEHHGGLDVVVHNAGITRDKRLANMKADAWNSTLAVNLLAPQRITEHLLATRALRRGGRVIGVSSITGLAGNMGQTNYATSKAGVIGLVGALAQQAAESGVTINAVAPGFIETQMTAVVPLMIREAGRRMNSLSQGGQPVDVAETIAWLASPGSGGVNGTVTRVCGQSLLGA